MTETTQNSLDFLHISSLVQAKQQEYLSYGFSRSQDDTLKIFYDLAQEYETLQDFYRVCVIVPSLCLDVESRLYLLDKKRQQLDLICSSDSGLSAVRLPVGEPVRLADTPYRHGRRAFFPVFKKEETHMREAGQDSDLLIGMFEVKPMLTSRLSDQDCLFFAMYAGRIGFNLNNRILAQQNSDHLKFIKNLVADIEHNVIIPNMYFRHLFNQLRKKIKDIEELEKTIVQMKDKLHLEGSQCQAVIDRVSGLHQSLVSHHKEVARHHANLSLFLESLFRRDHFEQGRLVLRLRKCLVEKEIIVPQLEQYANRFRRRDIDIVRPDDMWDEEIPLMVDIGLLAQVYANLFSNAVKYTSAIKEADGQIRKKIAYGLYYIVDAFGSGLAGVKFNVFSTGVHLSSKDREAVFIDGFRGCNSHNQSGSGHGLNFVKQVVEIHGGWVGYEPTSSGNNFYFILPLPETDG